MPENRTQLPPYAGQLPQPICFWSTCLAADTAYPWHSHSWGELNYSFSGVMSMKLEHQIFLSPPPYGIWVPPHVEHQAQARYEANHCCLYIREELCDDFPTEFCRHDSVCSDTKQKEKDNNVQLEISGKNCP